MTITQSANQITHISAGVLYLTLAIFGVIGHGYIFSLLRRGDILRSPRGVITLHLTLANIGVVIGSPLPALSSFRGRWIFGDEGCQGYTFEGFLFGLAAVSLLFVLTLERYLANCWTEMYTRMSNVHFHIICLLAWVHSFYWSLMPLLGWSRYKLEPTGTSCTIDWMAKDENHISYIKSLTLFNYVLPFGGMLFCYGLAWMAMGDRHVSDKGNQITEKQMMKITALLIPTSIAAWTPYALTCLWQVITASSEVSMLVASISPIAAKSATAAMSLVFLAICPKLREPITKGELGKKEQ